MARDWLPKAAQIWADMERGLYDWPGKQPKNADGSPRVVKKQILRDCGQRGDYRDQNRLVWKHPDFLHALELENRRRDCAIDNVITEIEKVSGPLVELRTKMQANVQKVFERPPDAEDPEALSPKDYVSQALGWSRYIDELTGRTKSQEEQAIQSVVSSLVQRDKITADMMGDALSLIDKYRQQQDKQLQHAGFIDGELE